MASKTFTVTVDGALIGKRTSKTRDYTHAVLLTAEDPEALIRIEEQDIERLEAKAAQFEAALAAPKVKIRARGFSRTGDLGYGGQPVYHNYEIWLEGTGDFWHSNSKGEVKGGSYGEESGKWNSDRIYTAQEFLTYRAQEVVRICQEQAQAARERIEGLRAGTVTGRGLRVLSWHTSGPLAAKAASAASGWAASRPYVLPVDAK